jgi:hypothetical protein
MLDVDRSGCIEAAELKLGLASIGKVRRVLRLMVLVAMILLMLCF